MIQYFLPLTCALALLFSGCRQATPTGDQAFTPLTEAIEPALLHFGEVIAGSTAPASPVQDVVVFPNPAAGELSIKLELERAAQVQAQLLDVHGRMVATLVPAQMIAGGTTVMPCNGIRGLPAGQYFVRLSVDGAATARMVVLR